jgi:methylmalonyl-CoA/ethylmalonyl-CoA epimerase
MPALHLSRIGQIAINVRELSRAVAFYRDVLGMKFLFDAPGMAFFELGGVRLMLARPEQPEFDHPASIVYYRVADIQESHAALAEAGVKFDFPPHLVARLPDHDLWMASFHDPEGNPLALMCEVRSGPVTG